MILIISPELTIGKEIFIKFSFMRYVCNAKKKMNKFCLIRYCDLCSWLAVSTACRKSDDLKSLACFYCTWNIVTICYCHLAVWSLPDWSLVLFLYVFDNSWNRFLSLLSTAKNMWNFAGKNVRFLNYIYFTFQHWNFNLLVSFVNNSKTWT